MAGGKLSSDKFAEIVNLEIMKQLTCWLCLNKMLNSINNIMQSIEFYLNISILNTPETHPEINKISTVLICSWYEVHAYQKYRSAPVVPLVAMMPIDAPKHRR